MQQWSKGVPILVRDQDFKREQQLACDPDGIPKHIPRQLFNFLGKGGAEERPDNSRVAASGNDIVHLKMATRPTGILIDHHEMLPASMGGRES